MFNFAMMEYEVQEALKQVLRPDSEVEAFLAQLGEEKKAGSLRRRLATIVVRFALKLDPEAAATTPRQLALEAANVRD